MADKTSALFGRVEKFVTVLSGRRAAGVAAVRVVLGCGPAAPSHGMCAIIVTSNGIPCESPVSTIPVLMLGEKCRWSAKSDARADMAFAGVTSTSK